MEPAPASAPGSETATSVTVRYWASARAAAGVDAEDVAVAGRVSLEALVAALVTRHPGSRLEAVLGVCSVLVGDRPAGSGDRAEVWIEPGDHVEFLPPFAGG
jgi:sulfur-carrier protein